VIAVREIGGGVDVANAANSWSSRHGLLVEIERNGQIGRGETSPLPGVSSESVSDVRAELNDLILSTDVADLDRLEASSSALFAIETAVFALEAKQQSTSIAELLARGSQHAPEPVLASQLAGDPRTAAALRSDVRVVKFKVGPASAWPNQASALNAFSVSHPGLTVRLDFNETLSVGEAAAIVADIGQRPWRLDYIEDPCAGEAVGDLQSDVDIALDAILLRSGGIGRLKHLAEAGHVQVAVLKPALLGGIRRTYAIASALATVLDPVISHLLDGPIAIGACAELACAVAPLRSPARAAGVGPHPALAAYGDAPIEQRDGAWLRPRSHGVTVPK